MKLFLKAVLCLVAIAAVVSGCGSSPRPVDEADSGTRVTEVVLRNGVHCAVMDKPQGTSLSCDWREDHKSPATNIDPKGDHGTTITLATLPSGVQCATMDSAETTAISCNW